MGSFGLIGHLDQFRKGIGFLHLNTDGACVSGSLAFYVQAHGLPISI